LDEVTYALNQQRWTQQYVLNMDQLLASASKEQDFLIDRAVPAKAITMLVGQPGCKKSWLAYQMALSISRGDDWLNRSVKKGSALLLNYDNPTSELGRRLLRLGCGPADRINAHTAIDALEQLRFPTDQEKLEAIVDHLRPTLIVVDSLRQAHSANESDSQEMAAVMACFKRFTALGATVVVLHHTRKLPANAESAEDQMGALMAMRGSNEIAASADCVIVVRDDTASWAKARGWAVAEVDQIVEFSVEDSGDRTIVEET
jgi:RecA-family ATPase